MQTMTIIKVQLVSFSKRLTTMILDWGTYYLLLVYVYSLFFLPLLVTNLFAILLCIYLIRIFREAKVYISEIVISNDLVIIYYYLGKDEKYEVTVPIKDLSVKWYDSIKGSFIGSNLEFLNSKKQVLCQYSTGNWTKEEMIETKLIIEEIQKNQALQNTQ